MTPPRRIANDAVLVLDAELERRIAAAARLVDVAPTEFIVRAIQQRCAEVLGEQWRSAVSPDRRAVWAIRPTPTRVLQIMSNCGECQSRPLSDQAEGVRRLAHGRWSRTCCTMTPACRSETLHAYCTAQHPPCHG